MTKRTNVLLTTWCITHRVWIWKKKRIWLLICVCLYRWLRCVTEYSRLTVYSKTNWLKSRLDFTPTDSLSGPNKSSFPSCFYFYRSLLRKCRHLNYPSLVRQRHNTTVFMIVRHTSSADYQFLTETTYRLFCVRRNRYVQEA